MTLCQGMPLGAQAGSSCDDRYGLMKSRDSLSYFINPLRIKEQKNANITVVIRSAF